MSTHRRPPVVIGWTEYVDFPEWHVKNVRAKIDTGARSSALHVDNIEMLPGGLVAFDVVRNRKSRQHRRVLARVSRTGRVRSSSGHATQRIFVETTMRLGPVEKRIELSLTDRGSMIHRMLIGRSALGSSFLIDANKRLAFGKPERRRKQLRRKTAP
jgi:hypothetical protein